MIVENSIINCYTTQKDTAHALITFSKVEFKRHQNNAIIINNIIMSSDGCHEVLYKDITYGSHITTTKKKNCKNGNMAHWKEINLSKVIGG